MYFYIVEIFLVIEVFKLNNGMVGPLSMFLQKEHGCGCCTLGEEQGVKNK